MSESSPKLNPYRRHIILCEGASCSPGSEGGLYGYLKERLKELQLHEGQRRIHRSQSSCLGVCRGGPVAVVYPEAVWYHHLTRDKLDQIIREHLDGGCPVEAFRIPV